jgi:hypothetical protein
MLRRFRFRLITVFAAVTVLGCALAALQKWYHVPIRTGTISGAICYAKDFEKLVSSREGHKAGDFTLYTFRLTDPADLLSGFYPRPQLWPEKQQISAFHYYNYPTTGVGYSCNRQRPANRPIGGSQERRDFNDTSEQPVDNDEFWVGGVFRESAFPPKRYYIDCTVRLTIGMPDTGPAITTIADIVEKVRSKQPSPILPSITSRLRYTGSARDLLLFSRPIDDDLVQLVILDLR